MFAKRKNLWKDESGAAMVEFTAAALTFFLIVFGSVEFANAYYQWNAATKAMQWGARVAAVSSPVASDMVSWTGLSLPSYCNATDGTRVTVPGDYIVSTDSRCILDRVCASTNVTGSTGTCTNNGTYDAAAMQNIVFGRAANGTAYTNCQVTPANIGMCNLFTRIDDARKVTVRYQYTGLGYAGRPGAIQNNGINVTPGAVPTITVSLHQRATPTTVDANVLQFDFILIGQLMRVVNSAFPTTIDMPSFATTVTGEDLTAKGS